jgi:hypothetical protein
MSEYTHYRLGPVFEGVIFQDDPKAEIDRHISHFNAPHAQFYIHTHLIPFTNSDNFVFTNSDNFVFINSDKTTDEIRAIIRRLVNEWDVLHTDFSPCYWSSKSYIVPQDHDPIRLPSLAVTGFYLYYPQHGLVFEDIVILATYYRLRGLRLVITDLSKIQFGYFVNGDFLD